MFTEPRFKTRRERLVHELDQQRKWIERCENNGVSYAGENGPAIRRADLDRLNKLKQDLAKCR